MHSRHLMAGALLGVLAGCGNGASAPAAAPAAPTAPAPVTGSTPTAPAPAADPAPAAAPAAPAPTLGLPPAPTLPAVPDPRTADPWLARAMARFEPRNDLPADLDARYRDAIGALAPDLVSPDADRRRAAARACGRFGVATALYLPPILNALRAPAVQRYEAALQAAEAAIRASGTTPEQVQWEPELAQLEGTVAVLARQLIDGATPEKQDEAARLLGEVPVAVWLFLPRAGRDILDEPSRDALLAAQRTVWATAELPRVCRWLAVRNAHTLLVDRELLADPPATLRDRDYVVPDLVLNNTAGELLCDWMEVPENDQTLIVFWRTIRRIDEKPQRIEIEGAVQGPLELAFQLLGIKCRGVTLTLAADVDRTRHVEVFIRALTPTEAVQQFAEQTGLAVTGDAASGFAFSKP